MAVSKSTLKLWTTVEGFTVAPSKLSVKSVEFVRVDLGPMSRLQFSSVFSFRKLLFIHCLKS